MIPVVSEYLDECRRLGIRRVRLAHGRGKGVQRAEIRRLLAGRDDVASFEDEAPEWGGWGATVVRMK